MATASTRSDTRLRWLQIAGPFALVGLLVALFMTFDPVAGLREVPPAEALAVERTVLQPRRVEIHVRNDGPDPVTIAQVLVNEAYWDYSTTDTTLGRLEAATITVAYPWDEGLPLNVSIVTNTGLTFEHEIEAAAETPAFDTQTLLVYALLGVYIGIIPVAIGILWFPALRRTSRRWLTFFLALTVGLLVFLLVDTIAEGLENASATAGALDGLGLFAIGALGAAIGLFFLEGLLERRSSEDGSRVGSGLMLAYLIAAGIGLHNLGEGLAVGAALAAGEIALGRFLVLGFALHNTTEGLAIVAPLGREERRPSLWHFVGLGALAGGPTVLGAWTGGFAFSPAPAALAFGVAAGAIAQVVWVIGRSMSGREGLTSAMGTGGFVAGLLVMYATGLLTS
jgi:zinc transporter, ZIP family